MKNKLHQTFTIFMAMLVLLSSTGFGFIEHACMMRGKSMQFVGEKKSDPAKKVVSSCCTKSKVQQEAGKSFFKKTDCCKESARYEKVDAVSAYSHILAHFLKIIAGGVLWSVKSFVFIISEWTLSSSVLSSHSISFSSLFHGRSMLSFVQSFLI
jgi:hypothetical protein